MKKLIFLMLSLTASYGSLFSQEVSNNNKEVTIFWDTSFSMIDRETEKDLSFLVDYLKYEAISNVNVIVFSDKIIHTKDFNLLDQDYDGIQQFLRNSIYDGSTNYDLLGSLTKLHQESIFFTDNLSGKNLNASGFVVNSRKSSRRDFFEVLNKNFGTTLPTYLAKYIGIHNNSNTKTLNKNPNIKEINYSGTVYVDDFPLNDSKITVEGGASVRSDINGKFELKAYEGALLIFEDESGQRLEYTLTKDPYFNVTFRKGVEALSEVTIKSKQKTETKEKMTASGLKNEDKVGYASQSISNKDITKTATQASQTLQGKFSGVTYGANQDLSQVVIRGGSNSLLSNNYGLIVVDGVPMPRSSSSTGGAVQTSSHIDPNNIESITVLKGLAATNQYGTLGNNGVLLVTTKTGTFSKGKKKELKVMNNNVYDDTKLKINKGKKSISYINELSKFKKVNEAYTHYLTQRLEYLERHIILSMFLNFLDHRMDN